MGWLFLCPALLLYTALVLRPVALSVQYSFYDWDGFGPATWVGWHNYSRMLADRTRLASLGHVLQLLPFTVVLPTAVALVAAAITARRASPWHRLAQTVLFLPQVLPMVAAGFVWSLLYDSTGAVNQILRLVGLGSLARPWLADFDTALPAVGVVSTWLHTGFCVLLISAGISRIDPQLYDSARLDGAGPVREFLAVTLPGVRAELSVCLTVTLIAALATFDVVFIMTLGGPGGSTMVPGVEIYLLAFGQQRVGAASAMSVVLMLAVLAVVLPLSWLSRRGT